MSAENDNALGVGGGDSPIFTPTLWNLLGLGSRGFHLLQNLNMQNEVMWENIVTDMKRFSLHRRMFTFHLLSMFADGDNHTQRRTATYMPRSHHRHPSSLWEYSNWKTEAKKKKKKNMNKNLTDKNKKKSMCKNKHNKYVVSILVFLCSATWFLSCRFGFRCGPNHQN